MLTSYKKKKSDNEIYSDFYIVNTVQLLQHDYRWDQVKVVV